MYFRYIEFHVTPFRQKTIDISPHAVPYDRPSSALDTETIAGHFRTTKASAVVHGENEILAENGGEENATGSGSEIQVNSSPTKATTIQVNPGRPMTAENTTENVRGEIETMKGSCAEIQVDPSRPRVTKNTSVVVHGDETATGSGPAIQVDFSGRYKTNTRFKCLYYLYVFKD